MIFRHFKKKTTKSNKGFSLVELLCAIALLALIATPIIQVFYTGLSLNLKSRKMLAASDLTSGTCEFISTLTFDDFKDQDGNIIANGYKHYFNNSALTKVYPGGPDCTSVSVSADGKTTVFSEAEMDGRKFDVWVIYKSNKTGTETYFTYDVNVYVVEPGAVSVTDNYCSATISIPNSY